MKHTDISVFKSVRNSSEPMCSTNLLSALTSLEYKDLVEEYRSLPKGCERAYTIKEEVLPAFTVSGEFRERKKNGLVRHSGFVCLDFDNVDNPDSLKQWLSKLDFISFASLSVGGKGVFALVRIADTSQHSEYYKALTAYFETNNAPLDKHCGDVTRLRVVSYDEYPYINHNAKMWDKLPVNKYQRQVTPLSNKGNNYDEKLFFAGLEYIERHNIDITQGYSNWLSLGSFIKSTFGECGREYFHRLSQYHPDYNTNQCDIRWNACTSGNYGIGVFGNACNRAGMPKLKELIRW